MCSKLSDVLWGCPHEIVETNHKKQGGLLSSVVKRQPEKLHIRDKQLTLQQVRLYGNKTNGHGPYTTERRYQVSIHRGMRVHGRKERRYCQVYNNGIERWKSLGGKGGPIRRFVDKITTQLKARIRKREKHYN